MFSCACSLRSTQCALLIALAAAAGISRIEVVPIASKTPNESEAHHAATDHTGSRALSHCPALEAFTRPLDIKHAVSVRPASVGATAGRHKNPATTAAPGSQPGAFDESCRLAEPKVIIARTISEPVVLCFDVRTHSLPFAIGPPPHGAISILCANDARISDDSTAVHISIVRVVAISGARHLRFASPSPKLAGLTFNPSFVLRGEPEFAPNLTPPVAIGLPHGRGFAPRIEPRCVVGAVDSIIADWRS